ncbi:MAG: hypothetical protein GEU90_11450 [Gemmatimonas sp.]|nr:hypothetical protein [Gemmatimonas sp.]
MEDRREGAGRPVEGTNAKTESTVASTADRERVVLLECRLEQLRSKLDSARGDADHARTRLAESLAREADHARRLCVLQEELAESRTEIAALHRRFDRSEALRTELEGHLFETGSSGDGEDANELRRQLLAERHRAVVKERVLARLRARVEELLSSREILLSRVAEWQKLVREDGPEAADLSEYLSELRREIMDLERQSSAGEGREAALREHLILLGVDPEEQPADDAPLDASDPSGESSRRLEIERYAALVAQVGADDPVAHRSQVEPDEVLQAAAPALESNGGGAFAYRSAGSGKGGADPLVDALASADASAVRSELLRRLGATNRRQLVDIVVPSTKSEEPAVRAVAYEALSRLLEKDPGALEAHLRAGLGDADPRVRRRVVLAAATARGLAVRSLLGPLRGDPDPQVHRVVREVLRHTPPEASNGDGSEDHAPVDPSPSGSSARVSA